MGSSEQGARKITDIMVIFTMDMGFYERTMLWSASVYQTHDSPKSRESEAHRFRGARYSTGWPVLACLVFSPRVGQNHVSGHVQLVGPRVH